MNPAENYILKQAEPFQSIMIHVRTVILSALDHMEEKFSYSLPFFHYKKKPLVYLNILKGCDFVDVAFLRGVELESRFPELSNYNNRKQVRSLQFNSLEEIDDLRLQQILLAAAELADKSRTGRYD